MNNDLILVNANIARRTKDNNFTGLNTFSDTLTTNGIRHNVVVKTASYVATDNDEVIVCSKSSAMTITLPHALGSGQWYAISNIGTGLVTIEGFENETVHGELNQVINQYETIQLIDYSTNAWIVI